jgi:cytochrome c2
MKKIILLFLICVIADSACHNKTVPEISRRKNFPAAPGSAQLPVDNSPETIAAGKIVFETKCNRCHELKETRIYTTERLTSILRRMIPRAKLDPEQAKQVTSYVMANAKK